MGDSKFSPFEQEVAKALKRLWDYHFLGNQPHARLVCVQQRLQGKASTHYDAGQALSRTLIELIERFKPSRAQMEHSSESRYYTILYYAYVEKEELEFVARRLDVSERTVYRELPRAIRALAQLLGDEERAAIERGADARQPNVKKTLAPGDRIR